MSEYGGEASDPQLTDNGMGKRTDPQHQWIEMETSI
jgi:hypothetical protein